MNLEASSESNEVAGFAEALIVGADDYRHAIDRSLRHIVDAYAESAAYVCNGCIAVDGLEQAIAVDNHAVGIL